MATTVPKSKLAKYLSPAIGLILFCCAGWFLSRELQKYKFEDILAQLSAISVSHIVIACILAVLGHVVLVGFDLLGLIYVKRQDVPLKRVTIACLVSYVLSHNIGSWSGAPFRFRVYLASGLSFLQVTGIVAWCGITFWLGFLFLGGILLETTTSTLSTVFNMSTTTLRLLGVLFLSVISIYLLVAWLRNKPLKILRWEFKPPPVRLAIVQILISSLDWILAGSVLYFLFPEGANLPYITFIGVFVLAQASGFSSQIPGGLGVFETIFIAFLTPAVSAETVLGSLLAYRGVYYVIPLILGVITLGYYEIFDRKLQKTNLSAPNTPS